jgi:anti-sigma regulatory factor (Ser/Thr protein kinase)
MRGHASANSRDPGSANGARGCGAHDAAQTQAISFGVPGGTQAPRHARSVTSSHLRHIDRAVASDAELIISELVTNSVRHAGVGSDQLVTVDLILLNEHLRIAVTDPGCDLEPRLTTESPDGLGGHGLRLVQQLSTAWGVGRDAVGATQVWCDLVLDPGRGRVY